MYRDELPSPLSSEADIKIPKHKRELLKENNIIKTENIINNFEKESEDKVNITEEQISKENNTVKNVGTKPKIRKKRGRKKKKLGKYYPFKTIYEYDSIEKLTPRQQILCLRRRELIKNHQGEKEIPYIPLTHNLDNFLDFIRNDKKRRRAERKIVEKKDKGNIKKKIIKEKINTIEDKNLKFREDNFIRDKTKLNKILKVMEEEIHRCHHSNEQCNACMKELNDNIRYLNRFISKHYCAYKRIADDERKKAYCGKNIENTLYFLKSRKCCNF